MKQNNILSLLPVATIILLAASVLPPASSRASDLEREQRLAEQTVDAIFDGEPVMLQAEGHDFLGIFMAAEGVPERGAAIILHGRGTHPDWGQVAGPLRTTLPAHGWTTLSLQMPVLGKEATYYDYLPVFSEAIPRIDAGIRYLREHGATRIAIIAHSCSVHMSMAWLEQRGDTGIDAYIGIGMGATDYRQPMPQPFPFDRIRVPLLNIYGSNDYPAVQRQAERLATLLPNMHPASSQLQIAGANHYFEEYHEALAAGISPWLNSLPEPAN